MQNFIPILQAVVSQHDEWREAWRRTVVEQGNIPSKEDRNASRSHIGTVQYITPWQDVEAGVRSFTEKGKNGKSLVQISKPVNADEFIKLIRKLPTYQPPALSYEEMSLSELERILAQKENEIAKLRLSAPDNTQLEARYSKALHDLEKHRNRNYELEQAGRCALCLDEEKIADWVFLPCGHCAVCTDCLNRWESNKCPFCRQKITNRVQFSDP